jgi:hypothetical protein
MNFNGGCFVGNKHSSSAENNKPERLEFLVASNAVKIAKHRDICRKVGMLFEPLTFDAGGDSFMRIPNPFCSKLLVIRLCDLDGVRILSKVVYCNPERKCKNNEEAPINTLRGYQDIEANCKLSRHKVLEYLDLDVLSDEKLSGLIIC